MEYTLNKINPGSVARFTFFMMAIIYGIVFSIGYVFSAVASLFSGKIMVILGAVVGGLILLILSIAFFSVLVAAFSWLYAYIYNLLAQKFGGIKFELATEETNKKEK